MRISGRMCAVSGWPGDEPRRRTEAEVVFSVDNLSPVCKPGCQARHNFRLRAKVCNDFGTSSSTFYRMTKPHGNNKFAAMRSGNVCYGNRGSSEQKASSKCSHSIEQQLLQCCPCAPHTQRQSNWRTNWLAKWRKN